MALHIAMSSSWIAMLSATMRSMTSGTVLSALSAITFSMRLSAQLKLTAVGRDELRYALISVILALNSSMGSPAYGWAVTAIAYPAKMPIQGAPLTSSFLIAVQHSLGVLTSL